MTDRKPPGISWESFAEQQIREAQQAGKFDDLPGYGQPLAEMEDLHDEMWWLKKKVRSENLSLLPPSLQIRRDVLETLQRVWELSTEEEVRRAISALNDQIHRARLAAVWGPPFNTMPLDVDEVVAEWRLRRK